ncbi:MAG TPA: Ig-like domain-containing protein, partial [Pyrinomonadaceae bacterium]|nr:Ig-like domain-containing protein [Pyrinomonadaceae bacterium]
MKRVPCTSSPSNLSVFTSCLLSFLMLVAPVATLAGSVKAAEANAAAAESQSQLTAAQKTEAFLFNAPLPAATPDLSATMTDAFTDGDADLKAEFGDTITYTADIINDGPVDATGVSFNSTIDPNTEFVSGSVKVSPLAFNDSYVATKDTPLSGGASLLTNDTGQPGTPTLVVSAVVGCADVVAPFENCATAQGGEVDVNADGTFTYTPASGFEGSDSFNYTISNGVTPPNPGVDDTATVTFNVDAAPTVQSTTPADNALGVNPVSDITVTFSEPVDVTGTWFTISCTTSGAHTATVTGGPSTFTLNPDTNFVGNETCTVTIVAAQVTDQDSNDPPDQMAADYVFDFTTDAAPEVTTTSPANGDNGVTTNANIVVNFSENINANANSFTIKCPAAGSALPFAYSGASTNTNVITLNPTADLPAGVTCQVTVVANQIADSDAFDPPDNMAADYVFSFTTDAAPEVTTTTPTNGATNLATNTTIQINFSENVNATTNSFKIECPAPGNLQTFALSASPSNSFTLTPNANLPGGVTCTVTVIALQISDQDGNDPPDNMAADYVFTFTTDAAPQVTATTPPDNATNVANNTDITVTFSEPVNVNANWFQIVCATSGTRNVADTVVTPNGTNTVFTINPNTDFTNGELCTVTINAAQVEDQDSNDPPNNLTANYVFDFTIDLPPSVTTTTPTNGQTGVAANTNIVVNFSESVNATTNSFSIECPAPGNTQAFTLSASPSNSFTLNPNPDLPTGVECTVTVKAAEITDVDSGDPPDNMVADHVFTFKIPPVANDDTHPQTVIGNVNVNSANIPFSVTSNNDVFSSADPVTIDNVQGVTTVVTNTITATTAQGGTVVVTVSGADMGEYLYNPPAGYEGGDTFTYQITNDGGSDSATVSLPISGMVWFINNAAGAGDGRLSSPFNSLAAFQAVNNGTGNNPAAGDNIFIYESATAYEGPVTLLSNQRLFGQDSNSSLATLTGLNPPSGSAPFPTMAPGNGTITKLVASTAATNAINLNNANTGNTINGLTIGNTTGSGINGLTFGTLTVGDIRIDEPSSTRTGQALNLSGGVSPNTDIVNGTFAFLEASGGTGPGVVLTGIDSATGIVFTTGSLSGLPGADFDVDGGNASITYGGTLANSAGRAVDITNKTGGTVDFNGLVTDTGGTGINLQNNDASVLTRFDGGVQLSTVANNGIVATAGGTLAITDPDGFNTGIANTLTTTTGTPLNLALTNIHLNGLTFKSITAGTAGSGPSNGIVLDTTGKTVGTHGSLVVTGDGDTATTGGNDSGGTIQSVTLQAIKLTNTLSPSFTNVKIQNVSRNGVEGFGVTNFTFRNSKIITTGTGNLAGDFDVNAMMFADRTGANDNTLDGTVEISENTITAPRRNAIMIETYAGTISSLNISDNDITAGTTTNRIQDAIHVFATGHSGGVASITAATINNNEITGFRFLDTVPNPDLYIGGNGIRVVGGTNANTTASTLGQSIANPINIIGNDIDQVGSNMIAVTYAGKNGTSHFKIENNGTAGDKMSEAEGLGISVFFGGPSAPGDFSARVHNNHLDTIGLTNDAGSSGIGIQSDNSDGVTTTDNTVTSFTVSNNTISNFSGNGILATGINNAGTMNVRIINNNVTTVPDLTARFGIRVQHSNIGTQPTINLEMTGNDTAGGNPVIGAPDGIGIRKQDPFTFCIEGLSPSPTNSPEAYINSQNPAGNGTTKISGTNFTNCSVPDSPLLLAPDSVTSAPKSQTLSGLAALNLPSLAPVDDILGVSRSTGSAPALTDEQLRFMVDAAIARWAATGLSSEQLSAMRRVKFEVADLADSYLAESDGGRVRVDADAGGNGWFVDPTPQDDAEFAYTVTGTLRLTLAGDAPAGRIDLLTAIIHELGHELGLDDSYNALDNSTVMHGLLSKGERRLPSRGETAGFRPGSLSGTHYLTGPATARQRAKRAKAQAALAPAPLAPAVGDLPVTIGTIPAGKKVRVIFEVTVKSAASYTGTNAFVSAQGTVTYDDPNNPPSGTLTVQTDDTGVPPNTGETDPTNTPVDSQPDLVLTKDDAGATAVPGGTITYTLTYNNTNGKRAASGVVITETVPANTTFNSGASTAGWNCTPDNNAGSTCTLSIPDLPAGDAGSTATFVVTVLPLPAGVTDISNIASIADDGTKGADGTPADNSDTELTPVTANSDLSIVKSDGNVGVQAGNNVTYTLSYSNIGNQGATNVVITETVPADTTFESTGSTAGWSCADGSPATTTCTISIGTVAAGGSGSVTFVVTTSATPAGTEVTNTASIDDDDANGPDPSGNDSSTDTTPFDDVPTLGTYSDQTILVSQGVDVSPTAPPADDNPGFDTDVTVSGAFTGGATVDDDDGEVHITNAAPAGVYTVTVTTTDSTNQTVVRQFQLTVNKSDTTTALASSKNPSFNNQNVTFTATVTSNTAVAGPPTGTVDFFDGATLICDDAPLDGTGKATCSTSTLDVPGSPHSITATYNSDAKFATSTSTALMQVVNPSLNFLVNTLGDEVDDNIGDDRCDTDGNSGNGDQCTLRAAIQEGNSSPSDDVITFDAALNGGSIQLGSALPDLGDNAGSGNLTITGPGATLLTVERNDTAQFRIFRVPSGKTADISGLTLKGGDSDTGGGAVLNEGTATLAGVVVTENRTDTLGGGIRNNGTMTLTRSTVHDNSSVSFGGGVFNSGNLTVTESTIDDNSALGGGGINSTGPGAVLTVSNSTISDNRATGDGGGIRNVTTAATLTNVTVTENRADNDGNGTGTGGGIHRVSGTFILRNTIVAGNYNDPSPSNVADDISGTMAAASSFNNLIGAGGAGTLVHGVNNNQVGVTNPRLGPLTNNGGPTRTHALRPNSPALDAGDNTLATNAGLTNDQRGPAFNRFVDSTDADAIATVDIGAYEAQVTVEDISNKGTAEDTTLSAFNFEVTEDPGITGFTVTATSSDTTLVPNANLTLGGAGNTRTLAINPAANKFGTTTITVTVSGTQSGVFPVEMTDTFDFVVTPVADTPDVADVATNEETQSGPIFITKNPVDGAEVTHFRISAITGGTLYMPNGTTQLVGDTYVSFADGAAGLRFTPLPNYNGPGHFSVQAATGNIPAALGGGTDTSTISVNAINDQPTLGPLNNRFMLEDSAGETITLTGIGAGGNETQTLTVTAVSSNPAIVPNPTVNYTSPNSSGTISYTPVANANGTAVITVTVNDGGGGTETVSRTFSINITPVNDAPSFTKGPNQIVSEDPGPQSISNWATSISPGAPNESSQVLTFVVTNNSNPSLFSQQPAISPAGTLTFTPVANASGAATVTLILKDGSGTANSGQDMSSPPQTFDITVNAANDAPVNNVPGAQSVVKNGT